MNSNSEVGRRLRWQQGWNASESGEEMGTRVRVRSNAVCSDFVGAMKLNPIKDR